MTSCRNLFHGFLLSYTPLSSLLFSVLLFSYLHVIKITSGNIFFPQFFPPCSLFYPLLSLCFVTVFPQTDVKTEMFSHKSFSPVWRFAAAKTRTFSDCFMSSYLFLSSPCLPLSVFVSISPLSNHSLCQLSLSPSTSVFLSSFLSALCHSPLSLSQINMLANRLCDR